MKEVRKVKRESDRNQGKTGGERSSVVWKSVPLLLCISGSWDSSKPSFVPLNQTVTKAACLLIQLTLICLSHYTEIRVTKYRWNFYVVFFILWTVARLLAVAMMLKLSLQQWCQQIPNRETLRGWKLKGFSISALTWIFQVLKVNIKVLIDFVNLKYVAIHD